MKTTNDERVNIHISLADRERGASFIDVKRGGVVVSNALKEMGSQRGGGHQPESIYRVAVHLYLLSYCLFNLFLLSILEAFKFSLLLINKIRYLCNCMLLCQHIRPSDWPTVCHGYQNKALSVQTPRKLIGRLYIFLYAQNIQRNSQLYPQLFLILQHS